ncbi:MAG TPA: hypothetical protein PLS91_02260 [Candidatus Paceibacterota bacterium]|nr:hypothetical protein [Candidatus Paceibacterota bacterium]
MTEKSYSLEMILLAFVLILLILLTYGYGMFFLNFYWGQSVVLSPVEAEELAEPPFEEAIYSPAPPGRAQFISPFSPTGGLGAPPDYPKLIRLGDDQPKFVMSGERQV